MPRLGVEGELAPRGASALLRHPVHVAEDEVDRHAVDDQPGAAVDPWTPSRPFGDLDGRTRPAARHTTQARAVDVRVDIETQVDVGVRAMQFPGLGCLRV